MKRIRRHDRDPVLADGTPHPLKILPVAFDEERLEVHYHRTGWRHLDYEIDRVKQRHTVVLILADGQQAGSLDINEFRVSRFIDSSEFLDDMDSVSQATFNFADVICANWDDISEISDYGDIVELNRAWMESSLSGRGRFSAATNSLIGHLFKGRSLLMLKAFPLEYEGKVAIENKESFLHRQRAMMRHYQRILAVSPFPGGDGKDGWMYSVPGHLKGLISPPSGRAEESSSSRRD